MSTNLQSDITEVRARLGEPYRTDEADSFFLDSEIIDWIYYGELQVWNDLPAAVLINGTSLGVWADLSAGSARLGWTDLATLTTSYKLVRVAATNVGQGETGLPGLKVPMSTFYQVVTGKNTNWGRYDTSSVTPTQGRFLWAEDEDGVIYTTAAESDECRALIVQQPTRRFKHLRDTAHSSGNSATHVLMSTTNSAIFTAADFFKNCGIKIVSGSMSGAQSTVSGQTAAANNDMTIATITTGPGQSFLYEVGEVSQFNDNLREPAILHACYLAALKDESPERAQGFLAKYERAIAALKGTGQ